MSTKVVVLDSGSGNLRSVERALQHVGAEVAVSADPEVVRTAERLVMPGQGAFADCMRSLAETGLGEALAEYIASGRPYFGICLGLQVLFEDSEEHGGARGLGVIAGHVRRFRPEDDSIKVPHIGWSPVRRLGDDPMLAGIRDGAHVYFVHSYYAAPDDPAVVVLDCDYDHQFAAAVRLGNLFACQFHPEKSQQVGLKLLSNFVSS